MDTCSTRNDARHRVVGPLAGGAHNFHPFVGGEFLPNCRLGQISLRVQQAGDRTCMARGVIRGGSVCVSDSVIVFSLVTRSQVRRTDVRSCAGI
jgi:hypothetical protein